MKQTLIGRSRETLPTMAVVGEALEGGSPMSQSASTPMSQSSEGRWGATPRTAARNTKAVLEWGAYSFFFRRRTAAVLSMFCLSTRLPDASTSNALCPARPVGSLFTSWKEKKKPSS